MSPRAHALEQLSTPVELLQNPEEFRALVDLYRAVAPRAVLEVGAGFGGSLYHWLRNAEPGTFVVSVDDHHLNRPRYDSWTPPDVELVVIDGNSHEVSVVKQVEELCPFDWVFIDADHHHDAVRLDWKIYSGLANEHGIVALHDILPSDDPTIEVDRLWAKLSRSHDTVELSVPGGYGIGVVRLRK